MAELDDLIAAVDGAAAPPRSCSTLLHEGGVPAGRIYRAKDMFDDPHFAAREAIVRVAAPGLRRAGDAERRARSCRRPPARSATAGPALGEHNDEVYRGLLGLSTEEIAALGPTASSDARTTPARRTLT